MHVSLHSYAAELLWMGSCLPSTGMLHRCRVIGILFANLSRDLGLSAVTILPWCWVAFHDTASCHMYYAQFDSIIAYLVFDSVIIRFQHDLRS